MERDNHLERLEQTVRELWRLRADSPVLRYFGTWPSLTRGKHKGPHPWRTRKACQTKEG